MQYDELTFFILKKIFDGLYNHCKIDCAREFFEEKDFKEPKQKSRYESRLLSVMRAREREIEKEGIIRVIKINGRVQCFINEERFKIIRMKNPFTNKVTDALSILEKKGTCANFEI